MCREHAGMEHGAVPGTAENGIRRREFLKLGGAGIAGALFLGSLGSGRALAQSSGGSSRASLAEEFRAAAREYEVPVGLLMAMGYVNTRWEMPPPEASEYERGNVHGWGGYGVMALVQNPSSDTLGEAAELTGLSEEELKTNRAANIRGGAALLAASQGRSRPGEVGRWLGAVSGRGDRGGEDVEAAAGVGGGEIFAEQVRQTLKRGAEKSIRGGERVSLAADRGVA